MNPASFGFGFAPLQQPTCPLILQVMASHTMKTFPQFFILTAIALAPFIVACGNPTEEELDPTQETVEIPYTQYINEERGLSFDIPENWELEVKNDTQEQFLIDLTSPAYDPDTSDNAKVMNYAHVNLFIWDKGEVQTPTGFRDFVVNLLKANDYNVVEKGKSNLGAEEAVYLLMEKPSSIYQYYASLAKYVISARDTRAFYMSLTYNDDISVEKEQEYLSILEHMTESFVWDEP